MAASFDQLFRTLASFSPPKTDLRGAPWAEYVPWAIGQGLAPLAAYNLEYRLASSGSPTEVREQLLALHQGVLNDNVMKLVNFKRSISELEGRRVVLLGGAAAVDSLYPHVGFRPVSEIRLLVSPQDLDGLTGYLGRHDFKPEKGQPADTFAGERLLSDGRTFIYLHASLAGTPPLDAAMLQRATPTKVYGPSMFRLTIEDALLTQVVMHRAMVWNVPVIELVDVRELVLGAPSLGAAYPAPPDAKTLLSRAAEWKVEAALHVALAITARLFPDAADAARALMPALDDATRSTLDAQVVDPVARPGRTVPLQKSPALEKLMSR